MTTFLSNREIYTSGVCVIVPQARERMRFPPPTVRHAC